MAKAVTGYEALVESFSSGFQILKVSFAPPDEEIYYATLWQSAGVQWECECWIVNNLQVETVGDGRFRLFQEPNFSVVFGDSTVEAR